MARGVRQGFPASGFTFAVAFDPIFRWLQDSITPRNPAAPDFLQPSPCAYADGFAVAASSFRWCCWVQYGNDSCHELLGTTFVMVCQGLQSVLLPFLNNLLRKLAFLAPLVQYLKLLREFHHIPLHYLTVFLNTASCIYVERSPTVLHMRPLDFCMLDLREDLHTPARAPEQAPTQNPTPTGTQHNFGLHLSLSLPSVFSFLTSLRTLFAKLLTLHF